MDKLSIDRCSESKKSINLHKTKSFHSRGHLKEL